MSDTQNTIKDVMELLSELRAELVENRKAIDELRAENKVQGEQAIFAIEGLIVARGTQKAKKKTIVVKGAGNTDVPATIPSTFANTMYWWAAMYASGDPIVSEHYTQDDIEAAIISIDSIKEKPEGYEKERAIGLSIWKAFPKTKKSGEMRTRFENWKKEKAKENSKDVEKEECSADGEK